MKLHTHFEIMTTVLFTVYSYVILVDAMNSRHKIARIRALKFISEWKVCEVLMSASRTHFGFSDGRRPAEIAIARDDKCCRNIYFSLR